MLTSTVTEVTRVLDNLKRGIMLKLGLSYSGSCSIVSATYGSGHQGKNPSKERGERVYKTSS
jgi:hypothetical protein